MEDRKEFDEIFRLYYSQLYFFARQFLMDTEDCQDIVSDAFEDVWLNFSSIRADAAKSFLYTDVRRKCIDRLRHLNTQRQYAEVCRKITECYDTDDGIREMEERERIIGQVIDDLQHPTTREIFVACYVDHKKYVSVAEEKGISVSTVKKHIVKALKAIRERNDKK